MKKIKEIFLLIITISLIVISFNRKKDYLIVEKYIRDKFNKTIIENNKMNINYDETLKNEINELKSLLDLNNTSTDLEIINATVIDRNKEYWNSIITIDKGEKDGIKKNMAVITNDGLIGKILKTTKNMSEVKLLTANDESSKISVVVTIEDNDYYAVVSGYNKKNNQLKLSKITKNDKLAENSQIVTSGIGNYPRGIIVGKIVKKEIDSYDLGMNLYVEPSANFQNIHYVGVLKK